MLAAVGASACAAEPVSGGSSSLGGAPGETASGGANNRAERGGVAGLEASASAARAGAGAAGRDESGASARAGGAAGPAAGGSVEAGVSAAVQGAAGAAGAAGAELKGSGDGCELDAFARDFKTALAQSTAPSGCAIPIEGTPIGNAHPVSSAALDFLASMHAQSPSAFTFTLESCGTPRTATCANLFDKYAGSGAGGNLWILAHPFSETIERCSAGVELSVWSLTEGGINSGITYCLMGDRAGQALGYCVFDSAVCAAQGH